MDELSTKDHPDWWRPVGGSNAQDSTLERRSLVWNDEDLEDGDAPDNPTDATYKGKFFPRGMRGKIEQIQLYCRRTAVGPWIDVAISPFPCTGPYYTFRLVPGVGWAWRDIPFEEMWNYDSLFIWIYAVNLAEWSFDTGEPEDGHESEYPGVTWADWAARPHFRLVYTAETPGDVPVSGTINTIEVPSVGAYSEQDAVLVPTATTLPIVYIDGAGTLLMVKIFGQTNIVAPSLVVYYRAIIFADGARAYLVDNRDLTQSYTALAGRACNGEFYMWDPGDSLTRFEMNIRAPIKFRRNLEVRFLHTAGANVNVQGEIYANMQR